jgi:hypothetical protein
VRTWVAKRSEQDFCIIDRTRIDGGERRSPPDAISGAGHLHGARRVCVPPSFARNALTPTKVAFHPAAPKKGVWSVVATFATKPANFFDPDAGIRIEAPLPSRVSCVIASSGGATF